MESAIATYPSDAAWLAEMRLKDMEIARQEEARLAVMLAETGMPVEAVREILWVDLLTD